LLNVFVEERIKKKKIIIKKKKIMRLQIKIGDRENTSLVLPEVKITEQDLLFNVNIKVPDYMQKDFLASLFYNCSSVDKRSYAFQKLIVENDAAFWRSSVVNECIFDLQEKKLHCQFIDSTEMEWDMSRYCEIKLIGILNKLKRGKRKINLEKKKLIEKEEEENKKNRMKEAQLISSTENQKSKNMFSNLAFVFFPFTTTSNSHSSSSSTTSTTVHNKTGNYKHSNPHHTHQNNKGNNNNKNNNKDSNPNSNSITNHEDIVKNNIKEMILRKMYEYLKSRLKSELVDIYTRYVQHQHLNEALPQNYYIWLTNSYLHRYEQHILETESMMKVQIYGMEVLKDSLKKMRQQFIARFIDINHDKELYESLEVRLQDLNSLIIDKKAKTMNHESSNNNSTTSKKLGILKFFKRSGQKHKEESKEIREVKRLKTEMKQIQFMMSSLKLTTDPSKRMMQSKLILQDQSILPIVEENGTAFEEMTVSSSQDFLSLDTQNNEINGSYGSRRKEREERDEISPPPLLTSKKQRALKYKNVDELCYKLMLNDLNIEECSIIKYLSVKMNYNENNEMDKLVSTDEINSIVQPLSGGSTLTTEGLASAPMDDKRKKYLDYRKMISNLPQPKFILLHFLYPPFLNNMKRGIFNDISDLRDELLEQLMVRLLGHTNDRLMIMDLFGSSNINDLLQTSKLESESVADDETLNEIEPLLQQRGFIDFLFEKICTPQDDFSENHNDDNDDNDDDDDNNNYSNNCNTNNNYNNNSEAPITDSSSENTLSNNSNDQDGEIHSPFDTMMMETEEEEEEVDISAQTLINDNDNDNDQDQDQDQDQKQEQENEHDQSSPFSLELPFKAPLISSTNDQLMISEKILPATPTLLSTVSSFISTAETTAEETLTQISHITGNGVNMIKETTNITPSPPTTYKGNENSKVMINNMMESMDHELRRNNENVEIEGSLQNIILKSTYLTVGEEEDKEEKEKVLFDDQKVGQEEGQEKGQEYKQELKQGNEQDQQQQIQEQCQEQGRKQQQQQEEENENENENENEDEDENKIYYNGFEEQNDLVMGNQEQNQDPEVIDCSTLESCNETLINSDDKELMNLLDQDLKSSFTEKDYHIIYEQLEPSVKSVIDDIINTLKQKFKMYNETYATIDTVQEKNKELLSEINDPGVINQMNQAYQTDQADQADQMDPMNTQEQILNKLLTTSSNPAFSSSSRSSTSPTMNEENSNSEESYHSKKAGNTLSRLITTSSTLLDPSQSFMADSWQMLSTRIGDMTNKINKKIEHDYRQQKFSSYMLFSSYEEIKHLTKEFFANLTSEKDKEFSITDFEFTSSYLHLVATLNVIQYQVEDLFHKTINLMLEHENWRNERNKIITNLQERSIQENEAIQERRKRNNRIQTYLFKQYQLRQQYMAQQLKNKQEYYDKQQLYLLKQNKQLELLKKQEEKEQNGPGLGQEQEQEKEGEEEQQQSMEIYDENETEKENEKEEAENEKDTKEKMEKKEKEEKGEEKEIEIEVEIEIDRFMKSNESINSNSNSDSNSNTISDQKYDNESENKDKNKNENENDNNYDYYNLSTETELEITKENKSEDKKDNEEQSEFDKIFGDDAIEEDDEIIENILERSSNNSLNDQATSKEKITTTEIKDKNKMKRSKGNKTSFSFFKSSSSSSKLSTSTSSDFLSLIPKRVKSLSLDLESRIVKETYFQQGQETMFKNRNRNRSKSKSKTKSKTKNRNRNRLLSSASSTTSSSSFTNSSYSSSPHAQYTLFGQYPSLSLFNNNNHHTNNDQFNIIHTIPTNTSTTSTTTSFTTPTTTTLTATTNTTTPLTATTTTTTPLTTTTNTTTLPATTNTTTPLTTTTNTTTQPATTNTTTPLTTTTTTTIPASTLTATTNTITTTTTTDSKNIPKSISLHFNSRSSDTPQYSSSLRIPRHSNFVATTTDNVRKLRRLSWNGSSTLIPIPNSTHTHNYTHNYIPSTSFSSTTTPTTTTTDSLSLNSSNEFNENLQPIHDINNYLSERFTSVLLKKDSIEDILKKKYLKEREREVSFEFNHFKEQEKEEQTEIKSSFKFNHFEEQGKEQKIEG